MRLEIDKQRFKEMLIQFVGDAPYEIELIKQLLYQLPDNARETFMREYYFKNMYSGQAYVLQHAIYKEDIAYCVSATEVIDYLREHALESEEYLNTITQKTIAEKMKRKEPLAGYFITVTELKNGKESI